MPTRRLAFAGRNEKQHLGSSRGLSWADFGGLGVHLEQLRRYLESNWPAKFGKLQFTPMFATFLAQRGNYLGGLKPQGETLGGHLVASWNDLGANVEVLGAILVARSGMLNTYMCIKIVGIVARLSSDLILRVSRFGRQSW